MSTKDQAWAERVGREAVELWLPTRSGMRCVHGAQLWADGLSWATRVPDFRDRLTELACIAWVEDVAREVYGDKFHMKFGFLPKNHCWWVAVDNRGRDIYEGCDTLAEACIAAVRAMKGGE